ncbi:TPA: primase-helicase zinc-binding domain-containing protein, partial [Yersinia enterocolitica]
MTFVNDVRSKAKGHWEAILQRLDIPTNRSEGECPSCGGKTRYRFDDREGRGTYYCSHCGAGTGLDLVMKVNQCDARSAAEMVAGVMALPLPEPKPAREKPQPNIAIADKVAVLVAKTVSGESQYLHNKGLPSPSNALLSDGSLLLILQAMDGTTTGAQVINPDGSKRLLAGTAKKGSFIPVRLQSPTEDE